MGRRLVGRRLVGRRLVGRRLVRDRLVGHRQVRGRLVGRHPSRKAPPRRRERRGAPRLGNASPYSRRRQLHLGSFDRPAALRSGSRLSRRDLQLRRRAPSRVLVR